MGFWERLNANPADNLDSLKRSKAQLDGMRKQQSRARRAAKQREQAITNLEAQVDELRASNAEQAEAIDRLTRCLYANNVIEPADLAAILPESIQQDD